MSSDFATKRAALDALRHSKEKRLRMTPPVQPQSSTSSATTSTTGTTYSVPASQRDATVQSRYFRPSTPSTSSSSSFYSNYGTELVPNSSPLGPSNSTTPYQPYGYNSQTSHPNNWIPQPSLLRDPLSSSGGFARPNSSARPLNGQSSTLSSASTTSPHSLQHRGPSPDSFNTPTSPTSPDVIRPGQKRKYKDVGNGSLSSDDLSGTGAGPSKPRLVRAKPTMEAPQVAPSSSSDDEVAFNRFKMTQPTETPTRIAAAWKQARGDVRQATSLLADPRWTAPKPVSVAVRKPAPADTGRVREVDEEKLKARAAMREKAKNSMIYALQSQQSPPSASKPSAPPPSSPTSPPMKRLKRARVVQVVESGSEHEPSEEDDSEDEDVAKEVADRKALEFFNKSGIEALQELTGCTVDQANKIKACRPFESVDDWISKLCHGRKKAGPVGISPKLFEDASSTFRGYTAVDSVLAECERIGEKLRNSMASWTTSSGTSTPSADEGSMNLHSLTAVKNSKHFLTEQPSTLAEGVKLKEYQLMGINWLHLLYREKLSCILADEMGLGKTIQVISFLAMLKERGNKGPHLIIVPSSTLENWCREFRKFAPSISVQTYYASKEERSELRQTLTDTQRATSANGAGWEVLITTYNLAQGDERDRKFFKRIRWECCIFDEGHVLKNFQSQRYHALVQYPTKWRLLLTGTPLQNNLQELVSLMNFILPEKFRDAMESLRAIFKTKGDAKVTLLAQERVSRAKKMMTPFVLRRRKDQVLKDLPKKTVRIEWCDMNELQLSIYTDALQRSRKVICEPEANADGILDDSNGKKPAKKKGKAAPGKTKEKRYLENSSNVLMDLRKAASHPMLFRKRFTDDMLSSMTAALMKEPEFKKRNAVAEYVKEDMSVMTDSELQYFCSTYKCLKRFSQDEDCFTKAGKVEILLRLLDGYLKEGRKVLIFSQFTQILDILQAVLKHKEIKYLMLTGATAVDVRQSLVDEFTEDQTTSVFLLSTKAGGLGITLTAASVVIMYDSDYNPHNDRQAQDRAYRIGQTRDVDVVKLISRGTIEEDMLRLGETKLALDDAVAGDAEDESGESAPEKEMKTSLMASLRRQLEANGKLKDPPLPQLPTDQTPSTS